jgi:DNA repair exonuclease SbcCD ATPase subunit
MADENKLPEFYSSDDMRWHEAISSLMNELLATKRDLQQKTTELQEALDNVKQLKGLLPICASCKKIRDDKGYWQSVEQYVSAHSEAQFSHDICPECLKKLYPAYFHEEETEKSPDKPGQ